MLRLKVPQKYQGLNQPERVQLMRDTPGPVMVATLLPRLGSVRLQGERKKWGIEI